MNDVSWAPTFDWEIIGYLTKTHQGLGQLQIFSNNNVNTFQTILFLFFFLQFYEKREKIKEVCYPKQIIRVHPF